MTIRKEGTGFNALYVLSFGSATLFSNENESKFYLWMTKTERKKLLREIYKEAKEWQEEQNQEGEE